MHEHHSTSNSGSIRALRWALLINGIFLVIEFIGGLMTNSIALLADAGHMLTDVAALLVALIVAHLAQLAATKQRTYGYGRLKVLGAFINGLTLWLIVGVIIWESIHRLSQPQEVKSLEMLLIATAGLAANAFSALILRRHQKDDINVRGAFLHLIADSLGSVGAIIAGIAMLWEGWFIVDPIASILISIIIMISSVGIVKEAGRILLESAPTDINFDNLKTFLENLPGVIVCHDLHVWLIDANKPILTAHLEIEAECDQQAVLKKATSHISQKYKIAHTTIQLEHQGTHPQMDCG